LERSALKIPEKGTSGQVSARYLNQINRLTAATKQKRKWTFYGYWYVPELLLHT